MQLIKRISYKKWKVLYPDNILDWPCHVPTAHFLLFTEHDCLTPYLHRFICHLIHTVPSVEANLLWIATIFFVAVLSNNYHWLLLGSKMSNEEMAVICLCSFSFVFVILLSYFSAIGNLKKERKQTIASINLIWFIVITPVFWMDKLKKCI